MGPLIKIGCAILCLQIVTCNCFGQWQIAASAQLGKMSLLDKDFSATPFSAWLPGAAVSVRYERPRTMHSLSFSYLGGSLKTHTSPASTLDQDYINADYSFLYKLGATEATWSGGIGGSLMVLYNSRSYKDFINNNSASDLAVSAGAAGDLSYHFDNGLHGWSMTEQLQVPFISWLKQPATLTSFSGLFRLKSCLSLDRQLSAASRLSLAYCWDYYKIKKMRDVQQANHRLCLIYRLTL